jgi:hypothetical protein
VSLDLVKNEYKLLLVLYTSIQHLLYQIHGKHDVVTKIGLPRPLRVNNKSLYTTSII